MKPHMHLVEIIGYKAKFIRLFFLFGRYHSNEWAEVKMEELSNNPESPNIFEFEEDDKSNLNLENFVLVNEDGSYAETGKVCQKMSCK
jgi:hypothetical protein